MLCLPNDPNFVHPWNLNQRYYFVWPHHDHGLPTFTMTVHTMMSKGHQPRYGKPFFHLSNKPRFLRNLFTKENMFISQTGASGGQWNKN